MKKKLAMLLATVLMAFGTLTITATPASAHQYSAGTFWACGATKGTIPTVGHSWPSALRPGVVTVYCLSGAGAWKWYADWYENGTIVRVSQYYDCSVWNCNGPGGH